MAVLRGDNRNNTIWAPAGNNTLYGFGGHDVLGGHNSSDVVYGGGGNDTLYPGDDGAPDTLVGGRGDDVYWANGPEDVIAENAGEGIDTVIAKFSWRLGANLENLMLQEVGAWANGFAIGNELNNRLTGNSGNNVFDGRGGNDWIAAGAGNDTVYAGEGTDTLSGEAGNDVMDGGNGSDDLSGGDGDDTLYPGDDSAPDTLRGGAGNDVYWANGPEDVIVEEPGAGIDTVIALSSWTLDADVENVILQEKGAAANGGITGNALNNTLTGNGGENRIDGGLGDDTLIGGGGNDLLFYYGGTDVMTGGTGRDYFMVNGVTTPGSTVTITDFTPGEDWLYRTDYLSLTGMTAANGGADTQLVYEDLLHAPDGAPPVTVLLAGVSVDEIQGYLAPINGGASLAPLFIGRHDVPW